MNKSARLLLWGLTSAACGEPFDCALFPPKWELLYAWAPGAPAYELPEQAGFPLEGGETANLVIQMHYNNYANAEDLTDDTRVDRGLPAAAADCTVACRAAERPGMRHMCATSELRQSPGRTAPTRWSPCREETNNEMCFNIVRYYPAITLPQSSGGLPVAGADCTSSKGRIRNLG